MNVRFLCLVIFLIILYFLLPLFSSSLLVVFNFFLILIVFLLLILLCQKIIYFHLNLLGLFHGFTRITSQFGYRKAPTSGASTFHSGIDISATTGSNLVAIMSGKIIYTAFNRCKRIYY